MTDTQVIPTVCYANDGHTRYSKVRVMLLTDKHIYSYVYALLMTDKHVISGMCYANDGQTRYSQVYTRDNIAFYVHSVK